MHQNDLNEILKATGLPVVFQFSKARSKPPFLRFYSNGTANVFADNRVHQKVRQWRVILVTEGKDLEVESNLEAVLDLHGICYDVVDEQDIEQENLYQVVYEFEETEG